MHSATPSLVSGDFGLGDDLVDALLGICLAQASARRHELRHVGSIAWSQILTIAEVRGPQAQYLGRRLVEGVLRGRSSASYRRVVGGGTTACRRHRPEQLVDIDLSRVDRLGTLHG